MLLKVKIQVYYRCEFISLLYLLVLTIGVGNTHISLHPYGARDWSKGM